MCNLDNPLYINISMGTKVTWNPRCLLAFAWGAQSGKDFNSFLRVACCYETYFLNYDNNVCKIIYELNTTLQLLIKVL
jgi:hypothetical protein